MIIGEIGNYRRVSPSKYGPTSLETIFLTKKVILLFCYSSLKKRLQISFILHLVREKKSPPIAKY